MRTTLSSALCDLSGRIRKLAATLRFFRQAGRLRRNPAFDAPWYRAAYPDSAGWDAAVHFLAIGAGSGYRPHALFDEAWWRERRGESCRTNPFVDYLASPERWTLSPSPYLVVKADAGASLRSDDASPLSLYRASGGQAGLERSPLFDPEFYARNNPDVVAAGFDLLLHFIENGGREGRSPCVSFDAFHYLSANFDVKHRGHEPLRHFLMRGARQGRTPHRAIDPAVLMAAAPQTNLGSALTHYQASGRHGLAAYTHPRLPPPGAAAPLFDDWPWRRPSPASAEGRLLVLLADAPREALMKLSEAVADGCGSALWLVALDPASAQLLDSGAFPSLSLSDEIPARLPALLRAAAFSGPAIDVLVLAPPGHIAHSLVAEQEGLRRFSPPPHAGAFSPRKPLTISVVVPSYNHAAFIEQRLSSILTQRRAPCEIIVIDDASQDDSATLARAFAASAAVPIRVIARAQNSGSPFAAWAEGARLAKGDLLWIAESDDVADPRLLERLAPFLENDERIVMAYCQSAAIGKQGEWLADDHLFYTDDIDPHRWERPYIVSGEAEIASALAIKNTIPNVSAVLFRRHQVAEIAPALSSDRYCGDWRAYAMLAERGWIGYSPEALNHTRRHADNLTLVGERNALALREAQNIRLWLCRRPGTPEGTIRASFKQHQRETRLQRERHGWPVSDSATASVSVDYESWLSLQTAGETAGPC